VGLRMENRPMLGQRIKDGSPGQKTFILGMVEQVETVYNKHTYIFLR
jgi:hypothetical protein